MHVNFDQDPLQTKIHFSSCFSESNSFWKDVSTFPSIFILTEQTAGELFASAVKETLEKNGAIVTLLTLPDGEKTKSLLYQETILKFMIEKGIGKDTCLIALGGGALLDTAGFTASIYARGIPFIAIPTTLLAMIDASLGGKTALNAFLAKNAIGTFYPASHILINSECLTTLPEIQRQSALGEIIKYGLILDKKIFLSLQKGKALWDSKDPLFMKMLIQASLQAKKSVIEKDLKDQGLRRILNFGHTIAHALEGFFNYKIYHGHAVAIGLLIESHLSFQMNLLSQEELKEIVELIRTYGFTQKTKAFSYSDLEPFLLKDKKNQAGNIRFVLLSSIGSTNSCNGDYCQPVPKETLVASLAWYADLTYCARATTSQALA